MDEEEIARQLRQMRESLEQLIGIVARLAQVTLGEQAEAEVRELRPRLRSADDEDGRL
jgi:hypothetical protein